MAQESLLERELPATANCQPPTPRRDGRAWQSGRAARGKSARQGNSTAPDARMPRDRRTGAVRCKTPAAVSLRILSSPQRSSPPPEAGRGTGVNRWPCEIRRLASPPRFRISATVPSMVPITFADHKRLRPHATPPSTVGVPFFARRATRGRRPAGGNLPVRGAVLLASFGCRGNFGGLISLRALRYLGLWLAWCTLPIFATWECS